MKLIENMYGCGCNRKYVFVVVCSWKPNDVNVIFIAIVINESEISSTI